jgi:hypothetical protein
MRPRKPADWPKYMIAKRLGKGEVAYYWNKPSWAQKKLVEINGELQACGMVCAALGKDYGEACRLANAYNMQFEAWRTGKELSALQPIAMVGTVDWLIAQFQASDKYKKCSDATRGNYDYGLKLIAAYTRKSGQKFGTTQLKEIEPHHADTLFERLCDGGANGRRVTTASHAIRAMRRAWNVVARANSRIVPAANPFRSVEIGASGEQTAYATLDHLEAFVDQANALGHPSVALAALVSYYWLQREIDVLTRMMWTDYEPGRRVRIRHHKNRDRKRGEKEHLVWQPLIDPESGESLFPEIELQIAITPKHGPLMIMRDHLDQRRKGSAPHLPYTVDYVGKDCRKVAAAAQLPPRITFASFRHGGLTEGGDASATDSELLSGSGHKTRGILSIYTKRSNPQAVNFARKRLALRRRLRTQREQMSE